MKRFLASTTAVAAATTLLAAAPSVAPAASAPGATTGAPGATTTNTAVVNGTVNPQGQDTTYSFQYGTTPGYGIQTQTQSAGAGTTNQPVSATLTGLTAGTTYHYRVIATNVSGTTVGGDQTFTTQGTAPAPPAGISKPTATTGAAVNIAANSVQLNGVVGSNDPKTTYHFEYGTSTHYGTQTSAHSLAHTGPAQPINITLSALQAGQTYHYRLVVVNSAGIALGADRVFATKSASRVATRALTLTASSRRVTGAVVVTVKGVLSLPASLQSKKAQACRGRVSVQVKKHTSTISLRRLALGSNCAYNGRIRITTARLKGVSSLRVSARFPGNDLVGPKSAPSRTVAA